MVNRLIGYLGRCRRLAAFSKPDYHAAHCLLAASLTLMPPKAVLTLTTQPRPAWHKVVVCVCKALLCCHRVPPLPCA